MLALFLVSLFWAVSNTLWILAFYRERKRRIQAARIASHFFTLCQAMNDGGVSFVNLGGKPELRQ